jgi:hypothetical protein
MLICILLKVIFVSYIIMQFYSEYFDLVHFQNSQKKTLKKKKKERKIIAIAYYCKFEIF